MHTWLRNLHTNPYNSVQKGKEGVWWHAAVFIHLEVYTGSHTWVNKTTRTLGNTIYSEIWMNGGMRCTCYMSVLCIIQKKYFWPFFTKKSNSAPLISNSGVEMVEWVDIYLCRWVYFQTSVRTSSSWLTEVPPPDFEQ